jgi:hypothetical protein
MRALRTLSTRPQVTVDNTSHPVGEAASASNVIGAAAPLARGRVLSALPLNKSAYVTLSAPRIVAGDFLVADPAGNVLGTRNRIVVHRMLYANRTGNTRRL